MVSSKPLSCWWTVRARSAFLKGLLLLLEDEGSDEEDAGKDLQPQEGPENQYGEGPLLPSQGDSEDVLKKDDGDFPPRRGEQEGSVPSKTAEEGSDPFKNADKGLDPSDEEQGSAPAKNGPIPPVTPGALLHESDASVDEGACDAHDDEADEPVDDDCASTAPTDDEKDADAGGAHPDGDLLMEAKGFVLAAEGDLGSGHAGHLDPDSALQKLDLDVESAAYEGTSFYHAEDLGLALVEEKSKGFDPVELGALQSPFMMNMRCLLLLHFLKMTNLQKMLTLQALMKIALNLQTTSLMKALLLVLIVQTKIMSLTLLTMHLMEPMLMTLNLKLIMVMLHLQMMKMTMDLLPMLMPNSIGDDANLHALQNWNNMQITVAMHMHAMFPMLNDDVTQPYDVCFMMLLYASPKPYPGVKKKTSLRLCITINMPFHPGEHEVSHETVAGHAPREGEDNVHADHVSQDETDSQDARVHDVCRFQDAAHPVVIPADCSHDGMVLVAKAGTLSTYLPFPILRGSKGIYQDSEKQIEVLAKLVHARFKKKTKVYMLLIIKAILDPG